MTLRRRARSMFQIAWVNGILSIRTQPLYLINLVVTPLSFLFFVSVASHGALIGYGIAGGMLLTVLSIGTSIQTDMTHYRQDLKLHDVMVASPVEGPVYVTGLALSELLYSLPGVALFAAFWVVYTPPSLPDVLTVIGVLVLIWGFASALGFTLATYFADIRETFVFSGLIALFLTVLPPVYYPASYLTNYPWAFYLVLLSPTTYAADLMHSAFGLETVPGLTPAVDWAVLIGSTLALLALAGLRARWREP